MSERDPINKKFIMGKANPDLGEVLRPEKSDSKFALPLWMYPSKYCLQCFHASSKPVRFPRLHDMPF